MPVFECPKCGSSITTPQWYIDTTCENGHPPVEFEPVDDDVKQMKKDRAKLIAREAKERAGA